MNRTKNLIKHNKYKIIFISYYNLLFLFMTFIFIILLDYILTEKVNNNFRNLSNKNIINIKVLKPDLTERSKIRVTNIIPDYIYLNGNLTKNEEGYIYIDNNITNNVSLVWNKYLKYCGGMFDSLENIIEIDLSKFDTSKVKSMKFMFFNCSNLESINLNNIITSSVVDMGNMFSSCISLTSIDLSYFDTSKVIKMEEMFSDCNNLISLNLSSFNTSKVKTMRAMFYYCLSLEKLILSNFDTSHVTDMEYLFYYCRSLTSLDLHSFDVSNVEIMDFMFMGCISLTSLDLSSFLPFEVYSMESMFSDCYSLKYINFSNFSTHNVSNMNSFFSSCYSLRFVNISSFVFDETYMNFFFYQCKSLAKIELPKRYSLPYSAKEMFSECFSLISLDLSFFDFILCKTMANFFKKCYSLTSINLSNFDTENISNMDYMFSECNSLIELDLSNFNTSKVQSMNKMFFSCVSLTFLDLRNFDTFLITNMDSLFEKCMKLKTINFGNFKTSSVTSMEEMFSGCISLNSLNLSNFDTSKVSSMRSMFFGCFDLTSLDLSNFNTLNTDNMAFMFYGCKNLRYINFYNFDDTKLQEYNHMFFETSDKLIIYINNQSYPKKIISELYSLKCITYNLSINLEGYNPRIIYDKKICINDCLDDEIYRYEYDYFCYKECPTGTHFLINSSNFCENNQFECIDNYPFLNLEDKSCLDNCNSEDFFNKNCILTNNEIKNKKILISNIIDGIKSGSMNELLLGVINKNEDLIVINKDLYQITTSYNQNNKEYNNISSIKLNELENNIKDRYDISKNKSLIIFKIEYYINGLLIPIIEYEIFNPETKEKIDLNLFINSSLNIELYIPVSINENELYKYDLNNSYYQDICNITNRDDNIDLTLYERKNEFNNNNLSVCQVNCVYIRYDYNNKKVICQCKLQNGISLLSQINNNNLLNSVINKKSLTNLNLMKCYKIIFSKEGLIKNIGSYIILLIIFLFIILAIAFYFKGYDYLCNQINEILDKKYIENEIENNIKKNRKIKQQLNDNNSSYSKSINNKNILHKNTLESINGKLIINSTKIKSSRTKTYTDYEINNISYEQAVKNDERTFLQYYIFLLKKKHMIIFTFVQKKDYNSFIIKLCLFFFIIPLNIVINALFFNDEMMNKIYKNKGKYNLNFSTPPIIYSIIIISIIHILLKKIVFSQRILIGIKIEKNKYNVKAKVMDALRCLIIKYICFFIIGIAFLLLFWYYISSFCYIYKNTQLYLLKNALICYLLYIIYPFIFWLIPSIIRIHSLKKPGIIFYKTSQIISLL